MQCKFIDRNEISLTKIAEFGVVVSQLISDLRIIIETNWDLGSWQVYNRISREREEKLSESESKDRGRTRAGELVVFLSPLHRPLPL